jgi:hypothetical protein
VLGFTISLKKTVGPAFLSTITGNKGRCPAVAASKAKAKDKNRMIIASKGITFAMVFKTRLSKFAPQSTISSGPNG